MNNNVLIVLTFLAILIKLDVKLGEIVMTILFSVEQLNTALFDFLVLNAEFFIHILELVGLYFIVFSAAKALYGFFTHNPRYRLDLSEGLATGLEFKLGGEILRTVVVRSMDEIMLVGGIILLRVALTLLIHWEIKNEERGLERRIKETKNDFVVAMKEKAVDENNSRFLAGLENVIHQSAIEYFKEKTDEYLSNQNKDNTNE